MRIALSTTLVALCVLSLALSSLGQTNFVPEKVSIKSIVGKAEVRSPTTGKWRPARVGMQLKMKWDIRTFVESSVELSFESGSLIRLSENSVVNLSSILQDKSSNTSQSKLKVSTGQIWGNVKKLVNKNSSFSFETPTAVAAIRGTKLGLIVSRSRTIVDVYHGRVAVRRIGSRREVLVRSRQRGVVLKDKREIDIFKFEEMKKQGLDSLRMHLLDTLNHDTLDRRDSISRDTLIDTTDQSSNNLDPELFLSVESPDNNSTTNLNRIEILGNATPGAVVIIGTKQSITKPDGTFKVMVNLLPGKNHILVVAKLGSVTKEKKVTIEYTPQKENFLKIIGPINDAKIDKPIIYITGLTVGGAEVTINGIPITIRPEGQFTYPLHIPDEPGSYSVSIVSKYNGDEIHQDLTVHYVPRRAALFLDVASPRDGQKIISNSITVMGRTNPWALLYVNSRRVPVLQSGNFSMHLPVYERDIGDYAVRIEAIDQEGGDEIDKIFNVFVDGSSPIINKIPPRIAILGGLSHGASRTGHLIVQVFDYTKNDQLALNVNVNGSVDQFSLEPSEQEKIPLEEGKNRFVIKASDRAGNPSNILSGDIYYLPGPLTVDILEPDESQYVVDDLPPMPTNTGGLSMEVEVEIEDGIGSVPETIVYCRVNGVPLRERLNYIYSGKVMVKRGVNNFLLEAEDIAGNKVKKVLTIRIAD